MHSKTWTVRIIEVDLKRAHKHFKLDLLIHLKDRKKVSTPMFCLRSCRNFSLNDFQVDHGSCIALQLKVEYFFQKLCGFGVCFW